MNYESPSFENFRQWHVGYGAIKAVRVVSPYLNFHLSVYKDPPPLPLPPDL